MSKIVPSVETEFDEDHFDEFREFLESACGIVLGDNKHYLVGSRLNKIFKQEGLTCLSELVREMKKPGSLSLRDIVIDAMTTNETLWFRDVHPFEFLQLDVLDELTRKNPNDPIRIWSAACSSGQEPYSIGMAIDEYRRRNFGRLRTGVKVIATDISRSCLDQAQLGRYDTMALSRGLSHERLTHYFNETEKGDWQIRPEVIEFVEFKTMNLLDSFISLGACDVIFCRNVLIYFSTPCKRDILTRMHAALKPGGYLILGASESLSSLPDLFEMVQYKPGIAYRALK
jgi:chemotaxis protein methyltransferase CheR